MYHILWLEPCTPPAINYLIETKVDTLIHGTCTCTHSILTPRTITTTITMTTNRPRINIPPVTPPTMAAVLSAAK